MSMYFPNLLELSFLIVFAFPNAEMHAKTSVSRCVRISKIWFRVNVFVTEILVAEIRRAKQKFTFHDRISFQNLLFNPGVLTADSC